MPVDPAQELVEAETEASCVEVYVPPKAAPWGAGAGLGRVRVGLSGHGVPASRPAAGDSGDSVVVPGAAPASPDLSMSCSRNSPSRPTTAVTAPFREAGT